MNDTEEVVYHKDQMSLDFNWEEIDNELIKREATLAVECGDFDNWDNAYETLWDTWEDSSLTGMS
jgi:hypothetical protein